jgi:hypothetical protein
MIHIYGIGADVKSTCVLQARRLIIYTVLTISSLSLSKKTTYRYIIPTNVNVMMLLVSVFIQLKHYGSVLMFSVLPCWDSRKGFCCSDKI